MAKHIWEQNPNRSKKTYLRFLKLIKEAKEKGFNEKHSLSWGMYALETIQQNGGLWSSTVHYNKDGEFKWGEYSITPGKMRNKTIEKYYILAQEWLLKKKKGGNIIEKDI